VDPTTEFFEQLQERGREPLLNNCNGVLRFDLRDGPDVDRWFLTVSKGDMSVSREGSTPDTIVTTDRELAEGIWNGEVNAFAAVLRGEVEVEGDRELMVLFQRLLPSRQS
jgi:putative sterol carrier protein